MVCRLVAQDYSTLRRACEQERLSGGSQFFWAGAAARGGGTPCVGVGCVCVEDRRVRFPAVAALARARVAPCATGSRQSPDCLRPLSPRRPRVLASAAPLSSGNRPHFHGDSSRFRVPRARPGRRRTAAFRRRRLACVCGADAARCCRLAPPRPRIRSAMRQTAASVRLAGPRARSARPLHAPHISNHKIFMRLRCG